MNVAPVWLDGKLAQLALIHPIAPGFLFRSEVDRGSTRPKIELLAEPVKLTPRQEMEAHEVNDEIDQMFAYQPWDEEQKKAGEFVRMHLARAVKAIIANVPPSPDRSSAIRKIREARMDCNSAISFEGKY